MITRGAAVWPILGSLGAAGCDAADAVYDRLDRDGDGYIGASYVSVDEGGDCDDLDPEVHPAPPEEEGDLCGDGRDHDCAAGDCAGEFDSSALAIQASGWLGYALAVLPGDAGEPVLAVGAPGASATLYAQESQPRSGEVWLLGRTDVDGPFEVERIIAATSPPELVGASLASVGDALFIGVPQMRSDDDGTIYGGVALVLDPTRGEDLSTLAEADAAYLSTEANSLLGTNLAATARDDGWWVAASRPWQTGTLETPTLEILAFDDSPSDSARRIASVEAGALADRGRRELLWCDIDGDEYPDLLAGLTDPADSYGWQIVAHAGVDLEAGHDQPLWSWSYVASEATDFGPALAVVGDLLVIGMPYKDDGFHLATVPLGSLEGVDSADGTSDATPNAALGGDLPPSAGAEVLSGYSYTNEIAGEDLLVFAAEVEDGDPLGWRLDMTLLASDELYVSTLIAPDDPDASLSGGVVAVSLPTRDGEADQLVLGLPGVSSLDVTTDGSGELAPGMLLLGPAWR